LKVVVFARIAFDGTTVRVPQAQTRCIQSLPDDSCPE
jgi:hypothetical protein